jgi:uncharacterized membrane protein
MSHISRPETDWLATGQSGWLSWIAPFYQLAAGWLVMAIALPVEQQDLWVAIPCGVLMLLLGGWLAWMVIKGLKQLLQEPKTHWETLTLMSFVGWSLVIFLAIVFILRKDITQVPRYNFIYFPAVISLMAASLWASLNTRSQQRQAFLVLIASVASSVCVISNLVFLKPYLPDRVAANILAPQGTSRVVMAYDDLQDIALGLSFALTLRKENRVQFSFIRRTQGYESVWQKLFTLNSKQKAQRFWIIAPGLKKADFPKQVSIAKSICQINSERYYRIGIPYQGYDCKD